MFEGPSLFSLVLLCCAVCKRSGYSVRTAVWRYTAWFRWNPATLSPMWDSDYAEELYNHTADHSYEMDFYENVGAAYVLSISQYYSD